MWPLNEYLSFHDAHLWSSPVPPSQDLIDHSIFVKGWGGPFGLSTILYQDLWELDKRIMDTVDLKGCPFHAVLLFSGSPTANLYIGRWM